MSAEQVSPEHVAGLYFTYRRFYAFQDIANLMKEYAKSSKTLLYWGEVLQHLERLAGVDRIAEAEPPRKAPRVTAREKLQ